MEREKQERSGLRKTVQQRTSTSSTFLEKERKKQDGNTREEDQMYEREKQKKIEKGRNMERKN